ncbi:hypothetical protein AVEN_65917-1, partial [Araneus ventricosus]
MRVEVVFCHGIITSIICRKKNNARKKKIRIFVPGTGNECFFLPLFQQVVVSGNFTVTAIGGIGNGGRRYLGAGFGESPCGQVVRSRFRSQRVPRSKPGSAKDPPCLVHVKALFPRRVAWQTFSRSRFILVDCGGWNSDQTRRSDGAWLGKSLGSRTE